MTYEEHSVDVVDITMFPATIVNVVLRHRDFGSIENSGLHDGASVS